MMNKQVPDSGRMLQEAAEARLAEAAAATVAGIPARRLRAPNRDKLPVAAARQTAMYLSHVVFGLSLTRVGQCFGRDRTTVRHACALVEDSRDDPAREFAFDALEVALVALRNSQPSQGEETR